MVEQESKGGGENGLHYIHHTHLSSIPQVAYAGSAMPEFQMPGEYIDTE